MKPKKIDFIDFPSEDSFEFDELSVEDQLLFDDAVLFTMEATAVQAGKKIISRMPCPEEFEGMQCAGEIEVVRYETPAEVRWRCKRCRQKGTAINFRHTQWDLSNLPPEQARQQIDESYDFSFLNEEYEFDFFEDEFYDDEHIIPTEGLEEIEEWLEGLSEEDFMRFQPNFLETLGLDELPPTPRLPDGFNLEKLSELLYADWETPGGPLYIRGDLPLNEIRHGIFFQNARIFLHELEKQGRFGLTQAGNLKRIHVKALLEKCVWPPGYREKIKKYHNVLNEENVWLLHVLRVLLHLTGLIRKQKGNYYLVKKKLPLLRDERAGELFRNLLSVYFRRMNMGYLSSWDPYPFLQESVPFIFYRMQLIDDDWYPITEVMNNVLLEAAAREIVGQFGNLLDPEWQFYAYVLRPFELFGLTETRQTETHEPQFMHTYSPDQVRKTPLFNKLFVFSEPFKLNPRL